MSLLEGPSSSFSLDADRPKHERVSDILRYLSYLSPARNAREAHAMVQEAFRTSEASLNSKVARMLVLPFDTHTALSYNGKTVYVQVYEKHTLFIGENGSIDIRIPRKKEGAAVTDSAKPHPYSEMTSIFEKPGADQKFVWDSTS